MSQRRLDLFGHQILGCLGDGTLAEIMRSSSIAHFDRLFCRCFSLIQLETVDTLDVVLPTMSYITQSRETSGFLKHTL